MKLDNYFEKGSTYLKKKSIDLWLVTTATLTLNAFGILYLLQGDFYLFIALIVSSQIVDMFDKYNRNKTKENSNVNYNQMLEWVKLLTIFFAFTRVYSNYITNNIILIVFILLILSNIDYSVKSSIEIIEGKEKESQIIFWTKPYRKLKLQTLKNIRMISSLFNENLTFFYIILIMVFVHVCK
jgi:hypothetical protein